MPLNFLHVKQNGIVGSMREEALQKQKRLPIFGVLYLSYHSIGKTPWRIASNPSPNSFLHIWSPYSLAEKESHDIYLLDEDCLEGSVASVRHVLLGPKHGRRKRVSSSKGRRGNTQDGRYYSQKHRQPCSPWTCKGNSRRYLRRKIPFWLGDVLRSQECLLREIRLLRNSGIRLWILRKGKTHTKGYYQAVSSPFEALASRQEQASWS